MDWNGFESSFVAEQRNGIEAAILAKNFGIGLDTGCPTNLKRYNTMRC
jgi:hypothetical protein